MQLPQSRGLFKELLNNTIKQPHLHLIIQSAERRTIFLFRFHSKRPEELVKRPISEDYLKIRRRFIAVYKRDFKGRKYLKENTAMLGNGLTLNILTIWYPLDPLSLSRGEQFAGCLSS